MMTHRQLVRRTIRGRFAGKLLGALEAVESRRQNLARVLTYHRIDDAEVFEQHMSYLAANYNVVSVHDLEEALHGARILPPRAVIITFDDAYEDVLQRAWPSLERHQLAATVFVATGYPDQPDRVFWWDRLENAIVNTARRDELVTPAGRLPMASETDRRRALARLIRYIKGEAPQEVLQLTDRWCRELEVKPPRSEVLGWDKLRFLAGAGVTLAPHSRSHPFLNELPGEEVYAEVSGSMTDLEREVGNCPKIFAYPDGRHNNEVVRVLRNLGIQLAFTTFRGTNVVKNVDPLRLRRINMSRSADLATLRARLVHSSVYLNRWRSWFDRQPHVTNDP